MKTREVFDYSLLRGKIKEKIGTERDFAAILGITPPALCSRLNNKTDFTPSEILKTQKILLFTKAEIGEYFFTPKVQKSEQNIA